ncbi:hypothetical protein ElyMa_002850800, partial [Elysia marginata]
DRNKNEERQNASDGGNKDPSTAPTEVHFTADADDTNCKDKTARYEWYKAFAGVSQPITQTKNNKQANKRLRTMPSQKKTTLDIFQSGGKRARSADGRHTQFLRSGLAGSGKKQRREEA